MKTGLQTATGFLYTDEDVLIDRPLITLKNVSFCPITFYVMEKLLVMTK